MTPHGIRTLLIVRRAYDPARSELTPFTGRMGHCPGAVGPTKERQSFLKIFPLGPARTRGVESESTQFWGRAYRLTPDSNSFSVSGGAWNL